MGDWLIRLFLIRQKKHNWKSSIGNWMGNYYDEYVENIAGWSPHDISIFLQDFLPLLFSLLWEKSVCWHNKFDSSSHRSHKSSAIFHMPVAPKNKNNNFWLTFHLFTAFWMERKLLEVMRQCMICGNYLEMNGLRRYSRTHNNLGKPTTRESS